MTTAILQNPEASTTRERLPQVEGEAVPATQRATAPEALLASTALTPVSDSAQACKNSSALGRWVHEHKAQFSKDSPAAWYGIRNVANNMVSILGLMATIVPVRMGMGHVAKWADGKGMKNVQGFFSNGILQNSIGVGVSFSTFRTLYKMGQRAYDRVFVDPTNADQTTQAIHDLPKNWVADFKQIAPAEYPATMIASFGLVGIRAAFTPARPDLPQNHWKDVAACALAAYPVFFEITEHLGRDFQLARGYNTEKTNEHIYKDNQTLGEFFTRQMPAVAAGIVPYIGLNNLAYRKTGRQLCYNTAQVAAGVKQIDGFKSAMWKERPYELFFLYSLGRDLYYDAYDKFTGHQEKTPPHALEGKRVLGNGVPQHPEVAPLALPAAPTSKVTQASREGVATERAEQPEHAMA